MEIKEVKTHFALIIIII